MIQIILSLFLFVSAKEANPAETAVVLDVRTVSEYQESHAKNAINIDYNSGDFENQIAKLDKNKKYYVYCQAGGRSAKAVKKMKTLGFSKIEDLSSVDNATNKFGAEKK